MKKVKLFVVLGITLLSFSPLNVTANESKNDELVCFYRENCEGELEYVCIEPDSVEPLQNVCPPGCLDPEE